MKKRYTNGKLHLNKLDLVHFLQKPVKNSKFSTA